MKIKFLGTGGGRFCTIKQIRKTGGFFLDLDNIKVYVDPGPGALVNSLSQGIELSSLDMIFVSHAHTDHCNDLNAIIEAMTDGCTKKRGILMASNSVINGCIGEDEGGMKVDVEKQLTSYHKNFLEQLINCSEEKEFVFKDLHFYFINLKHNDPCTSGFVLEKEGLKLGYVADTAFFEELFEEYKGCQILIINLLRPRNKPWKGHMTTEGAKKMIEHLRPRVAILQHFGLAIIMNLAREEKWLKENCHSDTKIIFAKDFQEIDLSGAEKEKSGGKKFLKGAP
jgi:ribonuclease BN (tRNA processing enzyme)